MKPEIKISYNKFLDPIFLAYIASNSKWKDWEKPSVESVKEKVEIFRDEWSKVEEQILSAIQEFTGLSFKRNVIEVFVVSGNPRAFSRPIILKSGYTSDEFLSILVHELIHVLQSDNSVDDLSVWKSRFPEETPLTLNHITVNATLGYIYLDVLKDSDGLKAIRESHKLHSTNEYTRAWEIADEVGYKEVGEIHRSL